MNEQLRSEMKMLFKYGKPLNSDDKIIYYEICKNSNLALLLNQNNLKNNYFDHLPDDSFELKAVFNLYKGRVNEKFQPSGSGTLMSIAVVNFENMECEIEESFSEIEIFEGQWFDGRLVRGTYKTSTYLYDINPPLIKTDLYQFYVNGILGAEHNPGKKMVSTDITYEGTFGFCKDIIFNGVKGELKIEYLIDWIRKGFHDRGKLIFKGNFKNGLIETGEYKGVYFDFSCIYDKEVHYRGNFNNWLFNGYGVLEYNYDGGHFYHDRIKCTYSGQFKNGKKHGQGCEELIDEKNAIKISLINCKYEKHKLVSIEEIIFKSNEKPIFGYDDEFNYIKQLKFEGDINIQKNKWFQDENHINYIKEWVIPDDISKILGKGSITFLTKTSSSKVYKNYGEEKIDGTYKFEYGKLILDGTFMCLDERTNSISYELWRCGYLVKKSNEINKINFIDFEEFTNKFLEGGIIGSKDTIKKLLIIGGVTRVTGVNFAFAYILIEIIAMILIKGKDAFINSISDFNKEELLGIFTESINLINGEIEEIELELKKIVEMNSYYDDYFYNFQGGRRLDDYVENKKFSELNRKINRANRRFENTEEYFSDLFNLFNKREKIFKDKIEISIDNLIRDYTKIENIIEDINSFNISEKKQANIIQLNNKLEQFSEMFSELLKTLRNILVRLRTWVAED